MRRHVRRVGVSLCVLLLGACGSDKSGTNIGEDTAEPDTGGADISVDTADPADTAEPLDTADMTDTTEADTGPMEDTAVDTVDPGAALGALCQSSDECASGFCFGLGEVKVCAIPCDADGTCSDEGYTCATFGEGDDAQRVCAGPDDIAGLPCTDDSDCFGGASCTGQEEVVNHCTFPCDDGACDEGSVCGDDDRCVPEGGFGCTGFDAATQQSGACTVANTVGQCSGDFVCSGVGEGSCDAPQAIAELCNGVDDDCNGEIDDGLCDDANPCTEDACDANAADGCSFTPLTGDVCDDGDPCTISDACDTEGACVGDPNPQCECQSDDDCMLASTKHDACAAAVCDMTANTCVTTFNNEGGACVSTAACLTDGVCNGAGECTQQDSTCDDGNPCTADGCDTDGACAFTPAAFNDPCDDNNPCTTGDTCNTEGECISGPAPICDDANPCTTDGCDPAEGCVFGNNADPCNDGDDCTMGDVCSDGWCSGQPMDCSALDTPCGVSTCSAGSCQQPAATCSFVLSLDVVMASVLHTPTGMHGVQCSVHGGPVGGTAVPGVHNITWGFHTIRR